MAVSTGEFTSVLNDLIETCKDGEQGFREAAEGVQSPTLKSLFQEYSAQRAQFAAELQQQVAQLGKTPETTGSAAGALHRGWIDLKSAITGKDDKAIVNECERGEDVAMDSYRKALAKDIPSDLRSIIERQFQGVSSAHDRVRALKHGTASY